MFLCRVTDEATLEVMPLRLVMHIPRRPAHYGGTGVRGHRTKELVRSSARLGLAEHSARPYLSRHLPRVIHVHPVTPIELITVAIIDDNRLVREALGAMLQELNDLRVIALALPDPALLLAQQPHVLLLDAGLRDADSLVVAANLVAQLPDARVVVMDVIPVNEEIVEYVNAGVWGFVLKDATFDEFVATIRRVAAGEKVLPPKMTDSLFAQIARSAAVRGNPAVVADVRMTRREHEVIDLIGEGLSNKEIAQRLNIATHTVKSHVRNVMEKLTLHTRLQIAAYHHREAAG